jgi:hypothetical protein
MMLVAACGRVTVWPATLLPTVAGSVSAEPSAPAAVAPAGAAPPAARSGSPGHESDVGGPGSGCSARNGR